MKERVDDQLSNELRQASRSDTTISIIAIVVTFILFGIAMGFAGNAVNYTYYLNSSTAKVSVPATAAVFVSLIVMVVIDVYSIIALNNSKKRKAKIVENLARQYQQEGAAQYPVDDIVKGHQARGNLFTVILAALMSMGVILPMVMFINQIVEEL
jgi:uncharacterized membrane protein YcjF (UPF0283 family)